jgi:type II secretory pathway component PulF
MDAPSEVEVRQRLAAGGYSINVVIPTAPEPVAQPDSRPVAPSGPRSGVSAPPKELAVFFRQLASFAAAGVSAHEALVRIGNVSPNQGMRVIASRMAARVQAGERLSDAMTEFPRAFPQHVVGVVAAGELGGFLPKIIGDIALDYELAQRASARTARYWSWTIWLHVYGFLLTAPLFFSFYSPGTPLDIGSLLARYVQLTLKYVVPPLGILTIGYYASVLILRRPALQPLTHRLALRVPWAGRASKERSIAGFCRILWRLQSAGILPILAWDTASRAAENLAVGARLHAQVEAVRTGARFSDALAATGYFTSEDQRVLAAAEGAGQTADVLQRLAAYYEQTALASAGRAKWLGLRIAILAGLLSMGVLMISMAMTLPNMFSWVEWYFGIE